MIYLVYTLYRVYKRAIVQKYQYFYEKNINFKDTAVYLRTFDKISDNGSMAFNAS